MDFKRARGVSDDGLTIVGSGSGPSGGEAWIANLEPDKPDQGMFYIIPNKKDGSAVIYLE